MNKYAQAAAKLRTLKEELDSVLARWRELMYRDMKQVAPGIWIHKDFSNLSECLSELREWIP